MSHGPEYTEVEKPFLDQLAAPGWKVVTGNLDFPSATGRDGVAFPRHYGEQECAQDLECARSCRSHGAT